MLKNKLAILCAVLLILCISLAAFIVVPHHKEDKETTQPTAIEQANNNASFNVYIPKILPKNYAFDKTSSTYSNDVLTYKVTNSKNQTITITQQTKPEQIDIESFSGLRFETDLGKASSLSDENTLSTAIITKDNVMILLTAPKSTGLDSIKAVINSLQKL